MESRRIVLVTGGTGLVGKGVEEFIKTDAEAQRCEDYIFLSSKDGDLRKMEDCKRIFEQHKPTHVLHLAAKVGGLFSNMRMKVEFYRENIIINDNVMECCRIYNVTKLTSCLSTCIFPDKTTYPINEAMCHDGPPHHSNEGYAYAKRMIDVASRAYREEYGCNFTCVIPTNIYGKYDNFSIEDGHVLPGLIHKCYLAQKNNTPFTIWGTGAPLRQFIYNVDLGALMVWSLRNYDDKDPIILSVDESAEVSIADAARMVASAMEFTGEIVFDTSKSDGQFKKTADNSKLRTYRPDFQFTPMQNGLNEVAKWFKANPDQARGVKA